MKIRIYEYNESDEKEYVYLKEYEIKEYIPEIGEKLYGDETVIKVEKITEHYECTRDEGYYYDYYDITTKDDDDDYLNHYQWCISNREEEE